MKGSIKLDLEDNEQDETDLLLFNNDDLIHEEDTKPKKLKQSIKDKLLSFKLLNFTWPEVVKFAMILLLFVSMNISYFLSLEE